MTLKVKKNKSPFFLVNYSIKVRAKKQTIEMNTYSPYYLIFSSSIVNLDVAFILWKITQVSIDGKQFWQGGDVPFFLEH